MRFFTDPKDFTHHGRFYGFPVYIAELESEGPVIAGMNVVWDWMILNVVPWIHWACEHVAALAWGVDYEERGWRIEVRGKIHGPPGPRPQCSPRPK